MSSRPPTVGHLSRTIGVAVLALAVLVPTLGLDLDSGRAAATTVAPGTDLPATQTGTGTTAAAPGEPTSATAQATSTTTTAPPAAAAVEAEVAADGLRLIDQTDWVAEGAPFDLQIAVGAEVGPDASLVLDLHTAVTSRSQFAATLEGQLLGTRRAEVVVPLSELAEEADGSLRLRLTQGGDPQPGERATPVITRSGVYPLVVSIRPADADDDAPTPFTTYLVRTPAPGTTPLQVAVVQPIAAPLAHRPDGGVVLDLDVRARLLALSEVLDRTAGTPLTLAPTPETLDALAQLAETSDGAEAAEAATILAALTGATAGRQVVAAPYVDLSVDALEAAGLGDDLAAQRRRGDDAVEATLGVRTDARTWIGDDGASPRSLRRLAALGIDQVVLPDASLSPVALRLSLTRPFSVVAGGEGFELEAVAPEPALSQRYAAGDPILGAKHLLADLAVLHGDEPGPLSPRGVVVAPPADVETDPVLLAAVLDGVASSPILEGTTLVGYFRGVNPQGGDDPLVRDLAPSGSRLGIVADDIEAARSRITSYAAMVEGEALTLRGLADLTLLAEADDLSVAERRAYLAAVSTGIGERVGTVGVVERASFRLPDSEGTIPLTLVRDGADPLRVRVTLQSERLEFGTGADRTIGSASYEIELTRENTPLVVPVRVRSPGTFPLLVTITSPDGRLEVARSQVTIRSTAFSGVGVALSALSGLFLVLWWGKHWRTVRRARRLVPVV